MLKKNIKLIFTLIGFVFGVIVAHPYVMLVYLLTHPQGWEHPDHGSGLWQSVGRVFSADMFPMAASFAIFCGILGLLLGILYERNLRLNQMKLEMEKKEQIMESMHRLLSVLSHFIINSNLVIGAKVRKLQKMDMEGSLGQILKSILHEAKRNEEVMRLVNQCEFLENLEDSETSMDEILKLTKQIEVHLSK